MTAPLEDILSQIEIAAPRDHVWNVMTSPDTVPGWLGCLRYELRVDHVFYMQPDEERRAAGDVTGATHCRIDFIREPEELVFAWFLPGTPETHVSLRLDTVGERNTRVTLTHSGWEQFPPDAIREVYEGLRGGWTSHVLPNLKRAAEG